VDSFSELKMTSPSNDFSLMPGKHRWITQKRSECNRQRYWVVGHDPLPNIESWAESRSAQNKLNFLDIATDIMVYQASVSDRPGRMPIAD
jgi:hypothetical protein